MSDLDKLMKRLKDEKAEAQSPQETEGLDEDLDDQEDEDDQEMDDDEDLDEDLDEDEVEEMKPLPKKIEVVEKKKPETPKEEIHQVDDTHSIEHEVALLQNDGVFRRELILTLKEFVDVHKVNTQTLIDLKKAVTGEKNAK